MILEYLSSRFFMMIGSKLNFNMIILMNNFLILLNEFFNLVLRLL
jgi:hypothetical protein